MDDHSNGSSQENGQQALTRLVGFCGYPHHGKTTSASALVRVYGYTPISFATPIKKMLATLQDLTHDHLYGALKNSPISSFGNHSPRYLLETLGTKWGRELISPDIWVTQAIKIAQRHLYAGGFVVFDDVRFHNEVKALKSLGAKIFRVVRPDCDVDLSLPANQEIADLDVDDEIYNDLPRTGLVPWERALSNRVFHICNKNNVQLDLKRVSGHE